MAGGNLTNQRKQFWKSLVSLRVRIVLGVTLIFLIAFQYQSWMHSQREEKTLELQFASLADELSRVIFGDIHRSMENQDFELASGIIQEIQGMQDIGDILVLDAQGRVLVGSPETSEGVTLSPNQPGCIECHRTPRGERPSSIVLKDSGDLLRFSVPIAREAACLECHPGEGPNLGMFIIDISMETVRQHVAEDFRLESIAGIGAMMIVAIGLYLLVDWTVVRRIQAFGGPLDAFAGGDLSARVRASSPNDEIAQLAESVNQMADTLERQAREQEERSQVRQRAIIEERERIAGELHDGLAQVLGYVSTKASAVRVLMEQNQLKAAEKQLEQLETAAQELFVDVREAILSLKLSGEAGAGLVESIRAYSGQFTRLSGIVVMVEAEPKAARLVLPPETELQLLRIVQEALTNIRKHSGANRATIRVKARPENLELSIQDNGAGFDPRHGQPADETGYGLVSMHSRARSIGAELQVEAAPGQGTRIQILLPLSEE